MPADHAPARPPTVVAPGLGAARTLRLVMAVVCLPYLCLKLVWLTGNPLGAARPSDATVLLDRAHIIGNVVTALLDLLALVVVVVLTSPAVWRLPVVWVLVPMWVGTGLLVPVVLGVPVGLVAQAVAGGPPIPAGSGLAPWVPAVVYGAFVGQAVVLAVAFVRYVTQRWPRLDPVPGSEGSWPERAAPAYLGAVAAVVVAILHLRWALLGPGHGGPAGFETVAQRSALAVSGLVIVLGALAVAVPARARRSGTWWWAAAAWLGSSTAFAGGLTGPALGAGAGGSLVLVFAVETLAGLSLGVAGLLSVRGRGRAGSRPLTAPPRPAGPPRGAR